MAWYRLTRRRTTSRPMLRQPHDHVCRSRVIGRIDCGPELGPATANLMCEPPMSTTNIAYVPLGAPRKLLCQGDAHGSYRTPIERGGAGRAVASTPTRRFEETATMSSYEAQPVRTPESTPDTRRPFCALSHATPLQNDKASQHDCSRSSSRAISAQGEDATGSHAALRGYAPPPSGWLDGRAAATGRSASAVRRADGPGARNTPRQPQPRVSLRRLPRGPRSWWISIQRRFYRRRKRRRRGRRQPSVVSRGVGQHPAGGWHTTGTPDHRFEGSNAKGLSGVRVMNTSQVEYWRASASRERWP